MLNYQRDPEGITWDCDFKMEIDQRLEYHCQKCRKNRNSQSGTLELPVSALNKWSTIGYVVGGCSAIPDAGEGIGMHNLPAEALVYNEQTWFVATLNGSSSLLIGMFLEIHWNHHHCFSVTVCQLWLDIIWSFLVQSNVGAAGLAEYRPHVVSHRKPLAGNLKDRDRVRKAVLVSEKWSVFEPKKFGNFISPTFFVQTKLMISARIREHLHIRKP